MRARSRILLKSLEASNRQPTPRPTPKQNHEPS